MTIIPIIVLAALKGVAEVQGIRAEVQSLLSNGRSLDFVTTAPVQTETEAPPDDRTLRKQDYDFSVGKKVAIVAGVVIVGGGIIGGIVGIVVYSLSPEASTTTTTTTTTATTTSTTTTTTTSTSTTGAGGIKTCFWVKTKLQNATNGEDVLGVVPGVASAVKCNEICTEDAACMFWYLSSSNKRCYLKSQQGEMEKSEEATSGARGSKDCSSVELGASASVSVSGSHSVQASAYAQLVFSGECRKPFFFFHGIRYEGWVKDKKGNPSWCPVTTDEPSGAFSYNNSNHTWTKWYAASTTTTTTTSTSTTASASVSVSGSHSVQASAYAQLVFSGECRKPFFFFHGIRYEGWVKDKKGNPSWCPVTTDESGAFSNNNSNHTWKWYAVEGALGDVKNVISETQDQFEDRTSALYEQANEQKENAIKALESGADTHIDKATDALKKIAGDSASAQAVLDVFGNWSKNKIGEGFSWLKEKTDKLQGDGVNKVKQIYNNGVEKITDLGEQASTTTTTTTTTATTTSTTTTTTTSTSTTVKTETEAPPGCTCSAHVDPDEGYGKCEKKYNRDYVCYVNEPSTCTDLEYSSRVGKFWSVAACTRPSGCTCSDHVDRTSGYGKCEKKYNGDYVCYVNKPSTCRDLEYSSKVGKFWSVEACTT